MKRLLFALLMCSLDAFAQHVSLDVAIQVSTNHMRNIDSSAFAGQYSKTDRQSAALKIYPNPSDGIITVDLPTDTIFSIRIYNTQGFLVYTDDNIVQHRYTLNIASFPQGVYFVVVHSRNSTYSLKFFKQ